jgi:hypothetical protein
MPEGFTHGYMRKGGSKTTGRLQLCSVILISSTGMRTMGREQALREQDLREQAWPSSRSWRRLKPGSRQPIVRPRPLFGADFAVYTPSISDGLPVWQTPVWQTLLKFEWETRTSRKRALNFPKYPDHTRKKDGKFLKGCTPKAALTAVIIHLLGRAHEGWLATPKPTLARGGHANRSSRILDSLQIFMICRSGVITSARPGGPSKQFRRGLIVSPLDYSPTVTTSRGAARE